MRLVAWNCMGGLERKAEALAGLAPDIAVVSETTRTSTENVGAEAVAWAGQQHQRGLAILAWNGWRIGSSRSAALSHFLAVEAHRDDASVTIVGVWPLPLRGDYVSALSRGLSEVASGLEGDVIVAGDFNANPRWDHGKAPARQFVTLIDELAARDLRSVWHAHSGEAHGTEQTPTFFWRMNPRQQFHIDYVFASARLHRNVRHIQVGSYEDWVANGISDHVPLVVDFDMAERESAGVDGESARAAYADRTSA